MSREENRKGHGRRLPTDATGCPWVDWATATPRQRFYSAYQYFRLEPAEPCDYPDDVIAKRALVARGEAAAEQSFDGRMGTAE
jgi:hypothetical protein